MNLGKFATRENSEKGVWVEPVLFGEKLGVEFCVIGADSDEARRFTREQAKEIASLKKEERDEIDWVERSKNGTAARIKSMRVVGNEAAPVELGSEVIENTSIGYKKIFTEIPEVQDFIWSFSEARVNFLSQPKENSKRL